jgi:hypothetical protein
MTAADRAAPLEAIAHTHMREQHSVATARDVRGHDRDARGERRERSSEHDFEARPRQLVAAHNVESTFSAYALRKDASSAADAGRAPSGIRRMWRSQP